LIVECGGQWRERAIEPKTPVFGGCPAASLHEKGRGLVLLAGLAVL